MRWTRGASPEDGQLLLGQSRVFLSLDGLLRHELHMRIGELHARFRHDLLVDPFHEARPVAALREDGAEVQEGEVDRRRPEGPSDLGLLGHVVREVRELVLGAEVRAVLPHHRADGLLRDFQDQAFRELHVALVGHVDDDLIPDERRVLRVVEDVRLDHEAVGDRDVPARETVPVEDAPELAERRVHRGDFDDVPAGVVQLDAVAELVEAHDRDDHPTDDVEERLLHDEDEGAEEDPGPDRSELRCAAAEGDEEDEGEGGRPHDVGDDLEVGEDVRLVLHVGAKGRPEDGPEQLEERLRGDQDRDDDDPRTELVEVARVPGREACDLEDAPEEQQCHDHDDREGKPEEGSRFPPIGGSHRPCPAVRGLFKAGVEVISPERPARTAAFQPKLFMGPRWSPRRGGSLTAEPVIDVRGLTKHYADIKAVDGISFEVEKGQMFALLGPNGAGKTTTVEILEGLRDPTSGEARVLGVDVRKGYRKIRNRVGVLPQDFEPFDRLKPREAVAYWAKLFDRTLTKEEVAGLIRTVGLADRADTLAMNLSGGEKRRLGIAMSLVGKPKLVFLDEPTTGLDPGARRELWGLIRQLKSEGTTILLTTHYLGEAEQLADDVAIMNHGKIVARGSPADLIAKFGQGAVIVLAGAGEAGLQAVSQRGVDAELNGSDVWVRVPIASDMRGMLEKLAAIDTPVTEIYTKRASLEDVFLKVVGARMQEGVLAA